jgi:4-amino-4-deoxy-L-arabinose transferase-like glycosyltransferase
LLTLCTFFILLGSRALNEPDEGRYSEIAREMLETGDWLVPHFWYLPHFDKPPLTYWLVAASMKLFGQNEWAVRLPVALAGLSGVWAAWLLGCSMGGRRVGFWSVLILQTNLLYFAMSRMLTTDIFLTQFVAWAIYFFWRSWLCLRNPPAGGSSKYFWNWHLAGWLAITLGFLIKGPIALVIPLVSIVMMMIFHWKTFSRKRLLCGGLVGGMALFFVLAAPWFLAVNRRVPHTLHYMIFHQAAGHVLGGKIRGRAGFPFYFFAILAAGLLPWTWLLGWVWRRAYWRKMPETQKEGWLLLNTWAIFTFTLFSVTHSKLPAYILPMFPAMAVMLALRFFGETEDKDFVRAPAWVWRLCALSPLFLLLAFSVALSPVYHVTLPRWMTWQAPLAAIAAAGVFWLVKNRNATQCAAVAVGVGIISLLAIAGEVSLFETNFKGNQTLEPLGLVLRENYHDGDALVCWGQLPEGLPFYSHGAISMTSGPYFGGMKVNQVPFEFPGNLERLGPRLLATEDALAQLLASGRRVWIVTQQERLDKTAPNLPVHFIARCGEWELLSNR